MVHKDLTKLHTKVVHCNNSKKSPKQAGAELGQAQPELWFGEKNLSLRGYIWVWG